MKKLLILSTLISSIALAQTEIGKTTAEMEITAEVMKPLTVTATSMTFGKIITGTTATAKPGKFTINGEQNANYIAYINEIGENKSSGTINLLNTDNSNKLSIDITTSLGPNKSLDNNGTATEVVNATTTTTTNTVTGKYKGKLTLIVRYQ